MRIAAINYNPAPDAEDRLRRLFTILLEHAAGKRQDGAKYASADATSVDETEEEC